MNNKIIKKSFNKSIDTFDFVDFLKIRTKSGNLLCIAFYFTLVLACSNILLSIIFMATFKI